VQALQGVRAIGAGALVLATEILGGADPEWRQLGALAGPAL
jgi:hypothetical protein